MTDTEILDWIENHLYALHQKLDDTYRVYWHDEDDFERETNGDSLKDCVERANERS